MLGGYAGRHLRVDLSRGTIEKQPLPDEAVLRKYVGGVGLGLWWLVQEITPQMEATDPGVPLLFMTGPLTGTPAPSSSNLAVVSLHYDIPFAVGTAHTHGYWAAYLKHAGYDAVIVTGRSGRPVYLWIDDDRVELRSAAHLWGKDTRDTERLIKQEVGGDPSKISVACIGPAGEALLHGASIRNDRNHGANKGSLGAVMGSKRMKAIAVRGSGQVPLADRARFAEVAQAWQDAGVAEPKPGEGARPIGFWVRDASVPRSRHIAGAKGAVAGKNLTDPAWGEIWGQRLTDAAKDWVITPKESYNCLIRCSYDCRVTTGPFAGLVASLCGGGENLEASAAMLGVEEPGAVVALAEYCDALGIDSAVPCAILAAAYELYSRGLLTREETGGLDLSWGNYESALALLEQMCKGQGFGGQMLTRGLKDAARLLGRGAESMVLHIRGGGINMHDWRPTWSILLGQILSSAGVCHQGLGVDQFTTEPDLGYVEFMPGLVPDGKAEAVAKTQMKKLWEDTLGVCWFACWGLKNSLNYYTPRALALATGWSDFDRHEALAVGERVVNLQRLIAVRRGFTKKDEFDVSDRLLEAPASGPAKGHSIRPHLVRMVEEYYRCMGWNVETGSPTPATLERLGLAGVW